jgi:hypothetical protein
LVEDKHLIKKKRGIDEFGLPTITKETIMSGPFHSARMRLRFCEIGTCALKTMPAQEARLQAKPHSCAMRGKLDI